MCGSEGKDRDRPPVEASWNDLLLCWRGGGGFAFWVMIQKLNSGEICTVRENISGLCKMIIFIIHIFPKDFSNCNNSEASLVLDTYSTKLGCGQEWA